MTQNERILKHLKSGRTLSQIGAFKLYGCFRLASRINDLGNEGYRISSKMVSRNGKRFAQYKII